MSGRPCEPMRNLHRSKQYGPRPLVDNFLITRSKSNGYPRPLVVWCITAKEGENNAENITESLLR